MGKKKLKNTFILTVEIRRDIKINKMELAGHY